AFLPDNQVIYQRMLVIVLDYSTCGVSAAINGTTLRSIFLGPNGDGSGGIAEKYRQCSYGKLKLNTTAFKVINVKADCTDGVVQSCNWLNMGRTGDTGAKALLGSTAFAEFTHFAYIPPPQVPCGWVDFGYAVLPGNRIWLSSKKDGVYNWATVMEKSLHNYGLWHSWKDGIEYNDETTVMGRGLTCPNAAELAYLGWATPAPGGDRIDSTRLRVGATLTFSLPATYLSPDGNYLRVVPDWLPSYSNKTLAKNLYIAVRVNKGGDALLDKTLYANRVHIHELNAAKDNAFPELDLYLDRKISYLTAITPLSQVTLTTYKLVVYGGSWVGTDVLRVHLCHYKSSPQDCPSVQFLELSPPPPSPQPSPPPPKPSSKQVGPVKPRKRPPR
ncbi:hypothetical protein VOLCADRAFT_42097, partial [Volvox carteri f. nagariensis]